MIEEIKLLLPLLETVSNGGIWLIAAYIGVTVLKIFAVVFVILFLVVRGARLIEKASPDKIKDICIDDAYNELYLLVMQSKSSNYFYKENLKRLKDNIKG